MKTTILSVCKLLALSLLLLGSGGCSKDPVTGEEGGGYLKLSLAPNQENVIVRSDASENIYKVTIYDDQDRAVKYFADHTTIPTDPMWLLAGNYRVEAVCGKDAEAEFAAPYLLGTKDFAVVANQSTALTLNTALVGVKVSVVYDEGLADYFTDYSARVSNGFKSLTFGQTEARSGYFRYHQENRTFDWNLDMTAFGGKPYTATGQIQNVSPNDHYKITFKIEQGEYQSGGLRVVAVVVNETLDPQGDTPLPVGVKRYPEILGVDFDIDEVQNYMVGTTPSVVVTLSGFPALRSARVTYHCDFIYDPDMTAFDLVRAMSSEALKNDLGEMFIDLEAATIEHAENAIRFDISRLVGNVALPVTGESDVPYSFTFELTDEDGSVITKTFTFNKLDSDVETRNVRSYDIWAKKITASGRWTRDVQPVSLGFEYRIGDGTWTRAVGTPIVDVPTKTFTMTITGLNPTTTYSIRAVGAQKGNTVTATTEAAPQLPYSNFDTGYWAKSGSAWYLRPSGGTEFWDSGNKGATTVGSDNPTEPESGDIVAGGAASLTSKVIMSNFAAGNLFAGEFISVDLLSTTPKMTFGRPFTGRPTSLKGYYKYNSKVIDNGLSAKIGKNDCFNMMVILTTGDNMPKLLNTKNTAPFDVESIRATGSGGGITAIAFGQFTNEVISGGNDVTPACAMSQYETFEIPLTYFEANQTKKPVYIVVIFSASKNGDYMTGGKGACLLLDEVELSYE